MWLVAALGLLCIGAVILLFDCGLQRSAGLPWCWQVIVVAGAKVGSSGILSGPMRPRAKKVLQLWKQAAAPRVLLSGGRSSCASSSQAEAGRYSLEAKSIPAASLILEAQT